MPTATTLTAEAVTWGYRLFLDRDPESQSVTADKLKYLRTTQDLRRELLGSEEYTSANPVSFRVPFSGHEPSLVIDDWHDVQQLFGHVQRVWERQGESEPYWSVLTLDRFRADSIHDTRANFYKSGVDSVTTFLKTLERNAINRASLTTCLEYGCGVGRVTTSLAQRFDKVVAYDISKSHLQIAERYMSELNQRNVTFCHVGELDDLITFPKVDAVYSLIVLQHNPPPLIRLIIRRLIQALNVGGVAFFQVPTYIPGYRFAVADYLAGDFREEGIETHVLAQREIFEIVREEQGHLLEVFEDGWAGSGPGMRSNTFLVQKA